MNLAQPQEITDRYPPSAPPRKPRTWPTVLMMLALLGVAGAIGYHALQLRAEGSALRRELVASQEKLVEAQTSGLASERALTALKAERQEETLAFEQTKAELERVNAELAAAHTRLDELKEERGAIEEQLAEFKQMTDQLRRMIDTGKLQVTFRRGRMIVELPAQVLFPSGSADLTDEGQKALAEVAKILRGMKGRHFIVAGHTDNVPVSGRFASNWELSSARAVTVTDALIRGGMKAEQLVAAGYSEYDPVAGNTSEKGRQKNRRIELILEPRLKPIPGLKPVASK